MGRFTLITASPPFLFEQKPNWWWQFSYSPQASAWGHSLSNINNRFNGFLVICGIRSEFSKPLKRFRRHRTYRYPQAEAWGE